MIGRAFDRAFDRIVAVEGSYSSHRDDMGGETAWGITEDVARDSGFAGDMATLGVDDAKRIYRKRYWDALMLDTVSEFSEPIANEMFDIGVNQGVPFAAHCLQRALNVLNRKGQDYHDIKVDGHVGLATVSALATYLRKRASGGERVMLRLLNTLQGARYVEITEARERNETFLFGWFDKRVLIR